MLSKADYLFCMMQTTFDQTHRKNLQLEVGDKILRIIFQPYRQKNEYFEMCQTRICTFKLFIVFSHNIEFGNIVRIKERNI